jgi:3-oxoacyl-(acyl-carrier-protein) synthase
MSRGPLFVRSLGQVSAAGTGVPALAARLGDPAWHPALGLDRPDAPPLPVATCAGFTSQGHLPPLVARRLDRPARLLAVAAREALAACATPVAPARSGVAAATGNAGTDALFQVLRAVFTAGPGEAPPMQFPSTVANAPASQLGILEGLLGPNVTFAEKQVGGLRALVEGGRMLARGRADAVVAAAVDEAQWVNAEAYDRLRALRRPGRAGLVLGEGAAALVVSRDPGAAPAVRVAGWASAASPSPTHAYPIEHLTLAGAIATALADAGLAPADLDLVVSMANGAPALDRLEAPALIEVLGSHRPAAFAVADRLGEGSFAGLLRVLAAALVLTGGARVAWAVPAHLAALGFPCLGAPPRTALVAGVAGGGSTIAVVLRA